MAKKITLETLAAQMAKTDARMEEGFASVEAKIEVVDARMERGFAAVAEDIGDIREKMATKDQIIALHTQVNAIEIQLRHAVRQAAVPGRRAPLASAGSAPWPGLALNVTPGTFIRIKAGRRTLIAATAVKFS